MSFHHPIDPPHPIDPANPLDADDDSAVDPDGGDWPLPQAGVESVAQQITVPSALSGQRFDAVAAHLFPDYSRTQLQAWIKQGALTLAGEPKKANVKVLGGETLHLTARLERPNPWQATAMDLDIVYEDASLLVINKPVGLVVHPAPGNYDNTLMNGLLHYCEAQAQLPRAGIVHRLDKDTSGLLVVAKTAKAQQYLVHQLQARTVKRQYCALVMGAIRYGGTLETAFGRDPKHRIKMAVLPANQGKPAITHYQVRQRFGQATAVTLWLETGRTHQIRVHMAHLGHGLIGDALYHGRALKTASLAPEALSAITGFGRQALHAERLGLIHPETGAACEWQIPLPADMQMLMAQLATWSPPQ